MYFFLFVYISEHKASELSYNQEIIESSDISEALVKVNFGSIFHLYEVRR